MNIQSFSNKELAFSSEERTQLGIRGLIPSGSITLENQVKKEMNFLRTLPTPLLKYIHLVTFSSS
jgi:malate dehydrogenase (oxaloacetate-decarboxylating)